MNLIKKCLVVALFMASTNVVFAQLDETAVEMNDIEVLKCEVLNPEDLARSAQLSNYSLRAFKSVKIVIQHSIKRLSLVMELSAGKFSLKPINPRVYSAKISLNTNNSLTENKGVKAVVKNIILKNVDEDEADKVLLSPNLSEGKILSYGAELDINCELFE